MEYMIGPMILGLLGYLALTIVMSLPGFLFRIKVEKFGAFEGKNKNAFLSAFGQPMAINNLENNIEQLVWMKASGNYMLKLNFNPEGNFLSIATQLDQTKNGVKGFIYGIVAKFI
jgi:hypothetical protein